MLGNWIYNLQSVMEQRPRPAVTSLALVVIGLGVLTLIAPLRASESPATRVGTLVVLAAIIELLHGLRRATDQGRRRAMVSGAITMAMALMLIEAPHVAEAALLVGLAGWFAIDGIRYAITTLRTPEGSSRWLSGLSAAGNVAVAILIVSLSGRGVTWTIAIAGAFRIFGIAWNIVWSQVYTADDVDGTVIEDLGFADSKSLAELGAQVEAEERARAPIDRSWIIAFVATLFAIHIGRMGTDGTFLGLIAPAVAVLGDMFIAVLITLLIVTPLFLSWRKSTRWIERWLWRWYLPEAGDRKPGTGRPWAKHIRGLLQRVAGGWLRYRLRTALRLRESRYSIPMALQRCLATGLPAAAIISATVPIWGMSWYFDTENWAAGMWNSWAESRTDEWREAMVRAVAGPGAPNFSSASGPTFAVEPPVAGSEDFSFLVIGDPGEGDASQQVLRDQVIFAAAQPLVKFLVISSDVIYPTGAMKDYEAKFWLQMKGVSKPVYAIPGNHDWYDALEAFLATFLQADAARASMRARAEADLRLTSTTDTRIEQLIRDAETLRREYGVPTGFQRGPFFEVQTDRFALLAIDTGIVKRIDPAQWAWLESALERSRGKFTMAVLGHPFYAGGHDMAADHHDFARIKHLLIERGVRICMAGDTHDLEYYAEPRADAPAIHHFVNGGGGAYLSFGTALAWPSTVPASAWAFYPNRTDVATKIDRDTPWWKRPAWWWTSKLGAWPFSAEWLSAVFDYNVAPFFQSFVEVRVENSTGRVRLLPYGVHGRLRWRDLEMSSGLRPADVPDDAFVEWIVPM
jgi:uncharacterized membrane protein HdeD (DUF308 family)